MTDSYKATNQQIFRGLDDTWNISPIIGYRDGKYYYLRFHQEHFKKPISIIKPFIPSGMEYKAGEENAR